MPSRDQTRNLHAAIGASGTWDWDIAQDELYVDESFADLYGLDAQSARAGLPSKVFFQAIHPADRARIRIAVAGILEGAEVFSKEFRVVTRDGAVLWMHGRGHGHRDEQDAPAHFTGVLVDVTDRKRTEERLRIAQTAGGIGTFEYIDGFATVTVSEEFCRLLGLHPATNLPVQTINGVVRPGEPNIIPGGRSETPPETLDEIFCISRNDGGGDRWIARRGEILREGAGYRLIGVIYDVTASKEQEAALRTLNDTLESRVQEELAIRRQAEDALRQAQKMEAVGQLTGGVAHDFNNLLMAISSSLALLRKRVPDDPDLHRMIDNALQGTKRGAALTQRMLAFARRQDLKPVSVDIEALVGGMTELLEHSLGPAWSLELDFPDQLPPVVADANQLEMAIMNLAVNARDAAPEGGAIRIRAAVEHVLEGQVPDLGEGRYLKLSVVDQGAGMDAETLGRAMEPFFTTKGVGKGTGLGLSMVDGLARQLNGTFQLDSEPGIGTTATLWLPASDAKTGSSPVERGGIDAGITDRRLKIVVVDDDMLILMNTADLLRDLGHEVLEAGSGQEGLDLFETHPGIDLLITDQAMPNMTGTQLAEWVLRLRPDLPIVLATGYGELPPGADERIVKLGKPFDQKSLEQALSAAIVMARRDGSPGLP